MLTHPPLPAIHAFFVQSSLVIVGSNPESADMDNPNGHVYGYAVYVVAETADGSRFAHDHSFVNRNETDAEARTLRLCERIEAAYRAGQPLNPNHWHGIEPCYGSPAYQREEANMTPEQLAE